MALTMVVECTKCGWFREVMPPDLERVPKECPDCAIVEAQKQIKAAFPHEGAKAREVGK